MSIYAKHNGSGFVNDIPARDLTRAEFAVLTEAQKAAVLACGAYDVAATKSKQITPEDSIKDGE